MGSVLVDGLLQNPQWWFGSWDVWDWLRTLFNQPLEVHTFLLGVIIGILLATLIARQHRRTVVLLTLLVVLFTFGSFQTVVLCSEGFAACRHVRLKPWYFLGGFLAAHLGILGVVGRPSDPDQRGDAGYRTIPTLLAAGLVGALLGFASYSFVSPTPVHPITGLATIGGLFGSALGLVAYEWATAGTDLGFRMALGQTLWDDRHESIVVIAYGTVLGFGYPRLFSELGEFFDRGDFLFGSIVWAPNGLPSVALYVFLLFVLTLLLVRVRVSQQYWNGLTGQSFAALVLGFVTYAFCLFVFTGYAGRLWFVAIPSA